ncbi:glycoside hydrolase family 15 protein [Phaeacidiphilus oryzae]|uniref:glycoside hydrolase family 15 protein n=1 Tax=Phaeacidiphilus oryzae TaxID=348818 RepID=UPI00056551A5|nr:glycoside hydrolase family 15 protein [Phaeacidiphilus oryzae]
MPGLIEDYAIIGDLHTVALVDRNGSIDWLCLPRFDSPSVFASLIGTEDHGFWRIAPDLPPGQAHASRRYIGHSLVLETVWETPTGTVRVLDFMPHRDESPDLVRIVEGVSGSVPMRSELSLRFDYGRVVPWVRRTDHHRVAVAGPDSVWMRTPQDVHTYGKDMRTHGEFAVGQGDRVAFVLGWQPSHLTVPRRLDAEKALRTTLDAWEEWSGRRKHTGSWQDAVQRSLITLKALTFQPTGGMVAAPTAGLPEEIGGERNWDYRYCWLRDSTMTLSALLSGGYREEAVAWRQWLLRAIAGDPADLQIMYGVAGERRLPETLADWLPGYEGSSPVRFGNAAVDQLQLDVYGEVVQTLYLALCAGIPMERHVWSLLRALMDFLTKHWQEPDEGLWEVRGGRRHFVHSKVMCWVAADRAVRMAEATGLPAPLDAWRRMRDDVHADVLKHGYDAERGVFTQYYGGTELDAATLFVVKTGFLPPDDPRVVRTVEAIQRELDHGGFIARYQIADEAAGGGSQDEVDGLSGREGAFLACSLWLADALIAMGRRDEAVDIFERVLALANDVGLLSEEWDPVNGRQLGNTPQAFTHVALVNTAMGLDAGASPDGPGRLADPLDR